MGRRYVMLGLWAAACGVDEIEMPVPPDVSAAQARVDAPTARLDRTTAGAVAKRVGKRLDDTAALEAIDELVRELLAGTAEAVAMGEATLASVPLRSNNVDLYGQGYLRIHRVCEGHEGPAKVDEARNGAIDLTATFTDASLDPVAWGTLTRCRSLRGGTPTTTSATIALSLGVPTPFDALPPTAPLLLSLSDLTLDTEGRAHQVDALDLSVCTAGDLACPGGRFAIALPVGDGTNLIMRMSPGDPVFELEAIDGSWTCVGDPAICRNGAGDEVILE